MKRIRHFLSTLEGRLTGLFILTSSVIFIANVMLFSSLNSAMNQIDQVFSSNVQIIQVQTYLNDIQAELTSYLNTNSSAALQKVYQSESRYSTALSEIRILSNDSNIQADLENIRNLSDGYLTLCQEMLSAKRGRNVQRYRENYDQATDYCSYLQSYLYSLNQLQLQSNSTNYVTLRQSFAALEGFSIFILVMVTVLNLVICFLTIRTSMAPMRDLAAEAGEIGKGNLDVPALPVPSVDEIGVVTTAFNEMVVSMRGYLQKLRESMELENQMKERELLMDAHLKEAQLKYLQAQINPHFLFNTLNAGAQLAMMEDAKSTYRYLQNVAAFFRSKTNRDEQITSLADEIRLVDSYMYIINVRFSSSIRYEKNIDEDLVHVTMPSMTLQPIVENAVNHGIRDIDWPAVITLSVYRTGNSITISVRDNGVGMEEQQMQEILSGEAHPRKKGDETNGVGLANVVNRLQLFYEQRDVFDITSAGPGKGTEVLLFLPMPDPTSPEQT